MTETIIMCAVLSIIVFCSQAILCLKAKQKTVKLIPGYIIAAVYSARSILLYGFALLCCLCQRFCWQKRNGLAAYPAFWLVSYCYG